MGCAGKPRCVRVRALPCVHLRVGACTRACPGPCCQCTSLRAWHGRTCACLCVWLSSARPHMPALYSTDGTHRYRNRRQHATAAPLRAGGSSARCFAASSISSSRLQSPAYPPPLRRRRVRGHCARPNRQPYRSFAAPPFQQSRVCPWCDGHIRCTLQVRPSKYTPAPAASPRSVHRPAGIDGSRACPDKTHVSLAPSPTPPSPRIVAVSPQTPRMAGALRQTFACQRR